MLLAIRIGENPGAVVRVGNESPSSSMYADGKSQERDGWVSEGLMRKTIRFWQKRSLIRSFYGFTPLSILLHSDR